MKKYNILICATGDRHVEEALGFLRSNSEWISSCEVSTDQPDKFGQYEASLNLEAGFLSKITAIQQCRFKEFLYVDCDTKIINLSLLEFYFDTYDLCATYEPLGNTECHYGIPRGYREQYLGGAEYQTGVLWVRKTSEVDAVIEDWYRLQLELQQNFAKVPDQLTFKISVHERRYPIGVFPNGANFRACYPQTVSGPIAIVHSRNPAPDSLPKLFLNDSEARLYISKSLNLLLENKLFSLLRRLSNWCR